MALISIVILKSSVVLSSTLFGLIEMPAFAKKTSRRPYFSNASSTTRLTSSSSAAFTSRGWISVPG